MVIPLLVKRVLFKMRKRIASSLWRILPRLLFSDREEKAVRESFRQLPELIAEKTAKMVGKT